MPAKVTLTVTKGALHSRAFVFAERTTCIIGRAPDCDPRIPDDAHHKRISRHHCLLDINPPDIRVRDFGSLNGAYVNGKVIGQREAHMTPEEGAQMAFPEYDLHDGDEITLSDTVLRVSVYVPAVCAECAAEIPEHQRAQAQRAPRLYPCEACRAKAERARRKEPPKKQPKVWAKCGKDVARQVGEHRQGAFLCAACQADPSQIVQLLRALARKGDKELLVIQGYSILQELGRGGMGAVYLAPHDQAGAQITLKVMLPQVAVEASA